MRRTVLLLVVAVMITLAGCAGAGPGNGSAAPTDGGPADTDVDTTETESTDDSDDRTGTVAFYISDEPNDIDDFKHLNATVTEVQFHYAGSTDDSNESETEEPETAETDEPDELETDDEAEEAESTESDENRSSSAAAAVATTTAPEAVVTTEESDDGDESDDEAGQAGWITRDINDTTVDLTELKGANATLLENLSMPAGKYTQVRLVVSEVNGTLTDGSDQRVKLPSGRLKLNKPFTLESGNSVNFVFDITVHEAGKSGKYILKPVAGESGTDQEIERVDAGPPEERGENRGDGERRDNGDGGQRGNGEKN